MKECSGAALQASGRVGIATSSKGAVLGAVLGAALPVLRKGSLLVRERL